jgi:putative sigma-54 modulation protein
LSSESQEKISSKVEKLSRFHDRIAGVDVTLDLQHEDAAAVEICVSVEKSANFVARANGGSLMGAVEGALHKLEGQLRRHKEKVIDQHRVPGKRHHAVPAEESEEEDQSIE